MIKHLTKATCPTHKLSKKIEVDFDEALQQSSDFVCMVNVDAKWEKTRQLFVVFVMLHCWTQPAAQ